MPYLGSTPAEKALEADDIASNAVTTAKIANDAVDTDKINLVSTGSTPSLEAKGTSGVSEGYIQLNCAENSHGIKLKSPPHSAGQSYTLTYPSAIVDGGFMKTDSSGNLSFAGAGKVLQVVSTTKTDTFSTSSDSFVDVTGLAVAITPSATSSKILVIASCTWTNVGGTSHNFYGRLMRDSTAIHVGTSVGSSRVAASFGGDSVGNNSRATSGINFLDSPSSTSEISYHIEARSQTSGQTVYVNRSVDDSDSLPYSRLASTVTAMEIGA